MNTKNLLERDVSVEAIVRPQFSEVDRRDCPVAPTLSPFAPASPDDLDKQHELGQFLTPNPADQPTDPNNRP